MRSIIQVLESYYRCERPELFLRFSNVNLEKIVLGYFDHD